MPPGVTEPGGQALVTVIWGEVTNGQELVSLSVTVLPVHLVTLGHLEEITKKYRSDCIPELFPTIEFFLGHMEVIKRVRNLYSHMFPCISRSDINVAKREILTLAAHLNTKLDQLLP